jgi:hypothetical protein
MLAYYYQTKGEWQESKKTYSFGEPIKHIQHDKSPAAVNFKLETFNSNHWRESIKMRAAAPGIWNTNMAETKRDYGVMVHTALSRVGSVSSVSESVTSMLEEGLINNEEKEHLMATITKILDLPELKDHFKEELIIRNEAEVITADGEMFRPDRVIINNGSAIIIDYKTGEEKPAHKNQIIAYGDLLGQMGYTVTEKLLVYIEEARVVPVQ